MRQTHLISLADRAAGFSLKLVGGFNILFVAAFYLALLFATAQAQARDAVACTGEDLLAAMDRDDPDALAKIRAEAAEVENGSGLLWRIENGSAAPSYLFGTMHMSDPRVVALPPEAEKAFEASSTVVIETTEVLDPAKMMAAMVAQPELTMFTDNTTLFSLLNDDDRATVEAALQKRGIPPASVAKMKPWMIASMVALPACEFARKAAGAPVLDAELALRAQAEGKSLEGLETIVDQLGAMASLPMDFHMRGLVETLALGDKVDDVIETMIAIYRSGETGLFWPFFRTVTPEGTDETDGGYAAFEETMVLARNRTMAERAAPLIDRGGAFIAVGALHLPGEEGVVALLREAGYAVTAVGNEASPPVVGGDVDAHGCRPSAGYSWCEKTAQCERPWELAQSQGFENTAEAFREYCGN